MADVVEAINQLLPRVDGFGMKMGSGVTSGVTKWGYISGVTGVTKLLPEHTAREGGKSPKNGLKYRKLTLSVQLFRRCHPPQSPVNSGFCVFMCRF